jgi:hypothetical protein
MTRISSQRTREANKRNARRSTGPRTARGKARAKLNALQHGLAAVSLRKTRWLPLQGMVRTICGDNASPWQHLHALAIAESADTLLTVSSARAGAIAQIQKALKQGESGGDALHAGLSALERCYEYERRAFRRWRRAMRTYFATSTFGAGAEVTKSKNNT